jgi:hypothetical protein
VVVVDERAAAAAVGRAIAVAALDASSSATPLGDDVCDALRLERGFGRRLRGRPGPRRFLVTLAGSVMIVVGAALGLSSAASSSSSSLSSSSSSSSARLSGISGVVVESVLSASVESGSYCDGAVVSTALCLRQKLRSARKKTQPKQKRPSSQLTSQTTTESYRQVYSRNINDKSKNNRYRE